MILSQSLSIEREKIPMAGLPIMKPRVHTCFRVLASVFTSSELGWFRFSRF